jgi:hypothetical protein
MTLDQIETEADGYGCDVVVAKDNELQFDLDDDLALERFRLFHEQKLFNRYKSLLPKQEWKSKSGNTHVVLTLPESLFVTERIALQSQGGSDPGREFAALCCQWDGSLHPILLFKPRPKIQLALTANAA